jgi:hypothetical protein
MAQKFIYTIEDQKADVRPIFQYPTNFGLPEPEPVEKPVEPAPKLPRPGSLDHAPKPSRPRRVK